MTTRHLIAGALSALFLAAAAPTLAVEPDSHDGAQPPHAITLDQGRKWATDAPLRQGMDEIRKALAAQHPESGAGKPDAAHYARLGATIEKNVGFIVANCKLSPEADANLHVIVAQLISAADDLQGRSRADPAEGVHKAVRAANLYGRYFQHPGWKPLA